MLGFFWDFLSNLMKNFFVMMQFAGFIIAVANTCMGHTVTIKLTHQVAALKFSISVQRNPEKSW